jgi:hypothetical protein
MFLFVLFQSWIFTKSHQAFFDRKVDLCTLKQPDHCGMYFEPFLLRLQCFYDVRSSLEQSFMLVIDLIDPYQIFILPLHAVPPLLFPTALFSHFLTPPTPYSTDLAIASHRSQASEKLVRTGWYQ